jgi:hypothetical protein
VDLEVEQTCLGAEHGSRFWFGDESQTVVVLIAEKSSLNSSRTSRRLSGIVPNSRHRQEVFDVALFTIEDLSQALLQLIAHGLSKLEEIIRSNINL